MTTFAITIADKTKNKVWKIPLLKCRFGLVMVEQIWTLYKVPFKRWELERKGAEMIIWHVKSLLRKEKKIFPLLLLRNISLFLAKFIICSQVHQFIHHKQTPLFGFKYGQMIT